MMRKSTALLIVVVTVSVVGAGVAFMQRARRVSTAQRNGSILRLDRDGDLQSAIDQARPGDTIVLEAGAVYTGPFTLPVKSGNEFITIQTSRVADLPEGVRVSPSQSALLPNCNRQRTARRS